MAKKKKSPPSVHPWRICPYGKHWVRTHSLHVPPSQTYPEEIREPDIPLDPNLVKALIASESGFNPNLLANSKNSNSARGLAQITNETRKLLDGDKGGLKDHLITATKTEVNDPSVNICAGVRWLFEKRRLASSHLKQPASWIDAIWEYKGTKLASKEDAEKIKSIFNDLYSKYQKCANH